MPPNSPVPYKPLIWAGFAALVFLSLFLAVVTQQTLETATTTNTVSFSGQGKVLATPDVAVLDLSILTEATTSKAAQDENSRKSQALTDFLERENVDEKDIKTTGYNIYPQYTYPLSGRPVITGYQVNQSVQVKVRDLKNVDTILDGVVSAGVNQVNNLQLTIDDPDKLMDEARQAAIDDAKAKASRLKSQLSIRLGRIINFSESGDSYIPPFYLKESRGIPVGGGDGPSVPTGENEIVINVSITYQIK